MDATERKLAQAKAALAGFVDDHLGAHIEDIVKSSGHEELRPHLKDFFARYFVLGNSIKGVKDPDEFETKINNAADLLQRRIKEATDRIITEGAANKIEIEHHKAELVKARNVVMQSKLNFPTASDELLEDPVISKILAQQRAIEKAAAETLRITYEAMDGWSQVRDALTKIERRNLETAYKKFKRWKLIRKLKQGLFRILLAGVIFGMGYGIVTSTMGKFFLKLTWWLYVVFAISTFVVKEYVISPWIRKKRLNQQREDLLKTFTDFMAADLNCFLLSYIRDEQQKKENNAVTATMMQEVRKDFGME